MCQHTQSVCWANPFLYDICIETFPIRGQEEKKKCMKPFFLNVWTKYLCPIVAFATRFEVVILLSISLLGWTILNGFAVTHHENVLLSKLIALTFEEATDAKRFSAASSLMSFVSILLALFVVTQYAFFGAWSVYEPMFFEHPDFLFYFSLAVMAVTYLCLLLPIYCKVLYALYRKSKWFKAR